MCQLCMRDVASLNEAGCAVGVLWPRLPSGESGRAQFLGAAAVLPPHDPRRLPTTTNASTVLEEAQLDVLGVTTNALLPVNRPSHLSPSHRTPPLCESFSEMAEAGYFTASQVIDKAEFLRLYRSVSSISNLLLAPFGFPAELKDVLEEDRIIDEYTTVYQQLEDVVAKIVFRHYGYDDDRIIASMHQYVGVEQDKQLMQEIKTARQILVPMVDRPPVVDFDFPALCAQDYAAGLFTDFTAQRLFDRVEGALSTVSSFCGLSDQSSDDESRRFSVGLERDDVLFRAFGVDVLKRMPSPILCLSRLLDVRNATAVSAIVETLSATLTVDVRSEAEAEARLTTLALTQEQANTLLDMFWTPLAADGAARSIEDVREGRGATALQAYRHPTGQFLLQLPTAMATLSSQRLRDAEESLAFVRTALRQLGEAKSVASMGDAESAAEALGEALDLLDFDVDVDAVLAAPPNEDDTDSGAHIFVPVALQVELLLARAKHLLEAGRLEQALVDVHRAIDCDASSPAAYAMRAQVRLAMIQRGQLHFGADDDGDGDVPALLLDLVEGDAQLVQAQDIALHRAAEDAMLGFLLSGSSDIAQAGLAEDLAKEAVRSFARGVFHRRRSAADVDADADVAPAAQPKAWLIGSYLSSYPLLSHSLGVVGPRTWGETLRRRRWARAQASDIDESDGAAPDADAALEQLPPDHLLDGTADERQVRARDVEAYDVMVRLVDLFESFAFGDAAAPLPRQLATAATGASDADVDANFAVGAVAVPVTRVASADELSAGDDGVVRATATGRHDRPEGAEQRAAPPRAAGRVDLLAAQRARLRAAHGARRRCIGGRRRGSTGGGRRTRHGARCAGAARGRAGGRAARRDALRRARLRLPLRADGDLRAEGRRCGGVGRRRRVLQPPLRRRRRRRRRRSRRRRRRRLGRHRRGGRGGRGGGRGGATQRS